MSSEDFVQIVPPLPRAEAQRQFEQWLEDHGLQRSMIEEDLRIDVMRGIGGRDYWRYRIRKDVIEGGIS